MKLYSNDKEIECEILSSQFTHEDKFNRLLVDLEVAPLSDQVFKLYTMSWEERCKNYIYIDKDKSKRYIIREYFPMRKQFDDLQIMVEITLVELSEYLWVN